MQCTVTVTDLALSTGLQRALDVYNAGNPSITQEQFIQKLVDHELVGLARSYVVTQMERITWLKERFTQAERAAIRQAAMTNGAIADLCSLVDGAAVVHFDDPVTIGGVQALEAAGLIGSGRGAEILAL